MKKLLIALAAVMLTAATYGQGSVVFNTRVTGVVDAPVTLSTTGAGPGPTYSAQLYLVNGSTLTALTPATTFRDGSANPVAAMYVSPVDVSIAGTNPGDVVTLRLRAWNTAQGTFDTATFKGQSADFQVTLGGGTLPSANLTGLQAFVVQVPEPTTLALGALGAVALLFRRRK